MYQTQAPTRFVFEKNENMIPTPSKHRAGLYIGLDGEKDLQTQAPLTLGQNCIWKKLKI